MEVYYKYQLNTSRNVVDVAEGRESGASLKALLL